MRILTISPKTRLEQLIPAFLSKLDLHKAVGHGGLVWVQRRHL